MKELVFYCDPCGEQDEKTVGAPLQVALGDDKPVHVDLCPEHKKELTAALSEVMRKYGYQEEQPKRTRRKRATASAD